MKYMSMFSWQPEYSVGYPDIDNQHKKLFELADRLHSAMASGKGKDVLGKTLADLIAYTKGHFAAEERLMQVHHYPDYAQHKAFHDALTSRVVGFQKEFEANRTALTVGLLQFLKDWLSHHIGETDRKIAAYLKAKAA
jgi:hemerythrin